MKRLKKVSQDTPVTAGKDSAMAEENKGATPPAASGGINLDDVKKLIQESVAATMPDLIKGAVGESLKPLADQVKAIQDTQAKQTAGLSTEDVAKVVSDQLSAQAKSKADSDAASAKKADVRKKVVEARLKGVPASLLASLPDTDDEVVLTAAADALRKDLETVPGVKLPNLGGASNDGGTPPAKELEDGGDRYTSTNSGLRPGIARYASSLKLPATKAVPAPAKQAETAKA